MLSRKHADRIRVTFDDHRLVANAGLMLPATLARYLGLTKLVDLHLDLGDAPGRANPGDKLLTLVASALADGDCIDDADALRSGGTARVLGCVVKAPSTSRFREGRLWAPSCAASVWGHVRQLDRMSRELLARAWATGAGPGDAPFTIDLDSTICETYGLSKEGARHHGYTGQRGYPRSWPWPPEPARCSWPGCARAGPTPPGAPPTSCGRRWVACVMPVPGANSRCGQTAASTPIQSSPSAAGWVSTSPSPSAITGACAT